MRKDELVQSGDSHLPEIQNSPDDTSQGIQVF